MSSQQFLSSGGETSKPLALRAGPLSLSFEPATGFLRQLRLGDHDVVRAIYAAIRDESWATILPQSSNLQTEILAAPLGRGASHMAGFDFKSPAAAPLMI